MFNTVHQELDVLSCRIKNISHARNGIQKTYLLSYCTSKSEQAENSLVLPRQYYFFFFYADNLNPIRSGLFQTVNDPGGGFKSPPLRSRKLLCHSSPYHTCEFDQVF